MKHLFVVMGVILTGCWVHRDVKSYQTANNEQSNQPNFQVNFKIKKDYEHRTFPFLFVEKSGKKNSWLVTASLQTPQVEIKTITVDLTITNQKGEILFEKKEREVELISFEGYNAKRFDIGTFQKELHSDIQDTLTATYRINFQDRSLEQSYIVATSYLIYNQERKTGSFF